MLIVRPGLSRLAEFDLGGRPLAAAYDMIFLMDLKGDDALVRQFQRSRRSLGLGLDTPYFNAGLMAIDRAAWRAEKLTERVTKALSEDPKRPLHGAGRAQCDFARRLRAFVAPVQFHGRFLPARPRTPPRADRAAFRQRAEALGACDLSGRSAFAENYRDWFAASPWPDWAKAPEAPPWQRRQPPRTRLRQAFAGRLAAFIDGTAFLDR